VEATDHAESLVDQARVGNQDAWAALYRTTYQPLLAYAHHHLGNLDDARDAVSETMARAVRAIHRFEGGDDGVKAWLVGICRHVVADEQRARYRCPRTEMREIESHDPQPGDNLLAEADQATLRAAFARLDPDEQELLSLRVVAKLSSDELAAALGKKPSAVRMAQMRALGRLRTFMEEGSRVH
jgi:RNA polymerase sigma-70 factor (ECF subfamily)